MLNLDIHAKLKKKIDQYYYNIGSKVKDKLVQKRIREITTRKKVFYLILIEIISISRNMF